MLQQLAHYHVEELLGAGSFASVYRAFDEKFERYVALKVLKPIWLSDPEAVGRFKQEAKTLAKLRHPHIADVFDVGEADGQVYLAQLLVEGQTLLARLRQGPLEWSQMLPILQAVASALDYAHAQKIVHRDVKPSNILLDKNDQAYLGDFGLVRAAERSVALSASSGGVKGTAAYIPPEVWNEEAATPATDIYALSCVIFEMITGSILFDGSSMMAVMRKHDQGPQFPEVWPVGIPPGTREVLQRGLAKDPAARFKRASELAAALTALSPAPDQPTIQSQPVVSTPPLPAPIPLSSTRKSSSRKAVAFLAGGGLLLFVAVCGLLVFISSLASTPSKPTAQVLNANELFKSPTVKLQPTATPQPSTPASKAPTATPNLKIIGTATAKAKATATIQAIVTASAKALGTQVAEAEVLFQEDFSTNKIDWYESKDTDGYGDFENKFINGKYRRSIILSKKSVITRQNLPNSNGEGYFTTKDFLLSVEATIIKASGEGTVSIIFRENKGDYYVAQFSNSGKYRVQLLQNGDWRVIKDWTRSYALNLAIGEKNTFALLVKGSNFTIFANGVLLETINDTTLSEAGEIGLAIGVPKVNQSLTVDFDNLIFRRVPGTASSPTSTPRPTPRPTQMPSVNIPAGKGKLVFYNNSIVDMNIDIIGPTGASQLMPPASSKQFILDPGSYTINSHSPGGKYAVDPIYFDIAVGQEVAISLLK